LLLISISSKCLPFSISFIFGNRKKSLWTRSSEQGGCCSTVICLVAKSSLTDSVVWAGALSRCKTPKHAQPITYAPQKETAIDQQHSCETLICQRQQTILRFLSTAAMASTR
jgi:hypothetical protein